MRHSLPAALLLAFVSGPALASPMLGDHVTVTSSTHPAATAVISYAGLPGGGPLDVYSGPEIMHTVGFGSIVAYCLDLAHLFFTPASYIVGLPGNPPPLTVAQVNNLTTLIGDNGPDQSATQLAVWSEEYGNAFSFKAGATTTADVATYLAALTGAAPAGEHLLELKSPVSLAGVESVQNQGFGYVVHVPEPGSIAVMGIGLLGVLAVRRRRATA